MSQVLPIRDRTTLAKLTRPVLQQIAKRERVKATGKNSDIIDRLLAKYPDGVPRRQTPVALGDNPRKRKSVSVKEEPDALGPSASTRRQTKKQRVDDPTLSPPEENDAVGTSASRSVRFTAEWVDATRIATAPAPELAAPAPQVRSPSPPLPPGDKDVRFVRRELARLINGGVDLGAEVDDLWALIESAGEDIKVYAGQLKELSCMRRSVETMITRKLKYRRQLWDGTYVMQDEDAKAEWDAFAEAYDQEMRALKKEIEEELIEERVLTYDDDKEEENRDEDEEDL